MLCYHQYIKFIIYLDKGKLVERQGRKAKGPKDYIYLWLPVAETPLHIRVCNNLPLYLHNRDLSVV